MKVYLVLRKNLETGEITIFSVFKSMENAIYDKDTAEKYNIDREYTYWIEPHTIQDM